MVTATDITVIDVNSHVYEPTELWDRHVPSEYQGVARSALFHQVDGQGNVTAVLNGEPAPPLNGTRIIRQAIWRPGMTPDDIGALDPDSFHELNPGAWDGGARLADLDQLGIDQQVLFPTIFLEYFPLVRNPDAGRVLARAYNDWVWELAQADPERLHPLAVLPLQSVTFAIEELRRVAERGFKGVVLRPMNYLAHPIRKRELQAQLRRMSRTIGAGSAAAGAQPAGGTEQYVYLDDEHFMPVWQAIEESGLLACIHPSYGWTNPESTSEGSFIERVAGKLGVGHPVAEPVAPMQDNLVFLTAALFHGLLEDLPDLRLAVTGANAGALPLALEKAETYLWLSFGSFLNPVSLEPADVWEQASTLIGFESWETPVGEMPDVFGEKAAWGSRYPTHDASGPDEAVHMLDEAGLDRATVERLMAGNAAELLGLKVPTST